MGIAMRILMVTARLPAIGNSPTLAPLARQIESLRATGLEVDVLQVRGLPALKYLQSLREFHRRAARADVIHAHYSYCGWLARTRFRKPVVISFMGEDVLGTPDRHGRISRLSRLDVQLARRLARWADAVIVKSQEMAEVLAPVRSHVLPNGVDVDAFRPLPRVEARRQLGWPDDRRYILFPGNPAQPRKGFSWAQRAFERARAQSTDRLELRPLWPVAPADVPLYMNACDAMLLTSYHEGSPNVLKEAMACNLPVVSVPIGDVAERTAGVSGYRVRPRDEEQLGAALLSALQDDAPCRGREAILRQGLDLASVAGRIANVYDEARAAKGIAVDRGEVDTTPAASMARGRGRSGQLHGMPTETVTL
jgi:glycosyltransferase involved in cell wall biosynthesis